MNTALMVAMALRIRKDEPIHEEPEEREDWIAAHKWVFDTNGHRWSNNDDTAGDNFGSFREGWRQAEEKYLQLIEVLTKSQDI